MKRVLCVVASLNTGGAETFLMKILRTMDKSKYMFDFIVCADGVYDEEVLELGGKIYKIPLRTNGPWKAFQEVKNIVKDNNYKYFLKLTDTPLGILDVMAAKAGGAKWISVRSCNAVVNSPFHRELLYSFIRPFFNALVNCKIAPSDLAAEYTFGKRQVKKGNVHFINNGVDLSIFRYDETFRNEIRDEFHIPKDALLVGHIGRFNRQKNHEYLLKIFEEIHNLQPNSYLILVGVGELQENIKSIVSESSYKDYVIFAGLRRDVPKILSAMDVFILPSFFEGMPNVVIEGQATGLPCFVSDTVTREADITGLVQYLSIEADPKDWVNAVLNTDIKVRKNTKEDFVKAAYDIQTVVDNLTRLLFQEF